jgi:hypothetical protein
MKYPTDADGYETVPNWDCAPGCAIAELERQEPNSARFFYVGKPDQEERNMGCHDLYWRRTKTGLEPVELVLWSALPESERAQGNPHISVKPIGLMRYLVRLITPSGGTVLDPFLGSGSTALACLHEELDFAGIEQDLSYITIASRRVAALRERLTEVKRQLDLFDSPPPASRPDPSKSISKMDIEKLLGRAKRRNS